MTDAPQIAPAQTSTAPSRGWMLVLARAAVAAVVAVLITFTSGHDAHMGLIVFAAFAFASAVIVAVEAWRSGRGVQRTLGVARAAVSLVAAVGAVLAATLHGRDLATLLLLVTGWAAITGLLEFYAGFRERAQKAPLDRDRTVVGILTVLLAIAFLVVPPDFRQSFAAPEGGSGVVTAPVVLVGIFGAYSAIVAVYLGIGAFSLKWAPASRHERTSA